MEHSNAFLLSKRNEIFSWVMVSLLSLNLILSSYLPGVSVFGYWKILFVRLDFFPVLESFGFAIVLAVLYRFMDFRFRWPSERLFSRNLNTIPAETGNLRVPYYGLFILNLPNIFYMEEQIFRSGTGDWYEIFAKSLGFGFLHYLIGCPLGYAVGIIGVGIWLSIHFVSGGIEQSFFYHSIFNFWMAIFWMISHIKR